MFQKGSEVEGLRSRAPRKDPGFRVPPMCPASRVPSMGLASRVPDEGYRILGPTCGSRPGYHFSGMSFKIDLADDCV